jgi:hypothetical protein
VTDDYPDDRPAGRAIRPSRPDPHFPSRFELRDNRVFEAKRLV